MAKQTDVILAELKELNSRMERIEQLLQPEGLAEGVILALRSPEEHRICFA